MKIDFNVTEQIKRFLYVYILEAKHCYLIDSGVYGCEKQIVEPVCRNNWLTKSLPVKSIKKI